MAFEGINIGRTSLLANQVALDTIGKNITHANDPHYSRQRIETQPLLEGGVTYRIQQAVSITLEKDLLREQANLGILNKQDETYVSIENVVNELSDQDLSTALDEFYQSLEQLSLTPQDIPARASTLEAAEKLSDIFHITATGFQNTLDAVDTEIGDTAEVINSLLDEIAELNTQIAATDGGDLKQPANDLRDLRRKHLSDLSEHMDITANEQSNGTMLVQSNGRVLIINDEVRKVRVSLEEGKNVIRWVSDNAFVTPKGGNLAGLINMRDVVLPEKMTSLDTLAQNLAQEFNKVHNQGRGLDGLTSITGTTQINTNYVDRALDIAEVDNTTWAKNFKPKNGTLTFAIRNDTTGAEETANIAIDLVSSDKMTFNELKNNINQINRLTASIDLHNRLTITSEDGYSFFIKEDTSDVSSFLGLNDFFTGSAAGDINVNETLKTNSRLLAAGKTAAPGDNANITNMLLTKDVTLSDGLTLFTSYEKFISTISTEANRISSLKSNQERILQDVISRRQSFSGVSLDEEAANLLRYQRSFQASAQYISVQNEVLEILMSLI